MKIPSEIKYGNCITNLSCSIRKYFDLPCAHSSLPQIDRILETHKPENVIVFLLDGMGSKILDRNLDDTSFFKANKLRDIYSVFPATTTACTTSMLTGLNPVEHGWLGWDMYIKTLDKTVTLFTGKEKVSKDFLPEFYTKQNPLIKLFIPEEINQNEIYEAHTFAPYLNNDYSNFDLMISHVKNQCQSPAKNGKRFIYAYDPKPDALMHKMGPDSPKVKKCLQERNQKIQQLCSELKNSLVIVLADHGHVVLKNINLTDFPQLKKMLERTPGIEQRTASFKVHPDFKTAFPETFASTLGNDFTLYSTAEVIAENLFGDVGTENSPGENPLFREALGDFLAVAESTNAAIVSEGTIPLFSGHAGSTPEEILVPLIVKVC